ncbi:MAG: hypothetical protein Q9220_001644 [cf. Caloplaca sp. 1 TL-2023]
MEPIPRDDFALRSSAVGKPLEPFRSTSAYELKLITVIIQSSSGSGFDIRRPSTDFNQSAVGLSLEIYDPYPDYNSQAWRTKWHGSHSSCEGPRGVDLNGNKDDMLGAYKLPNHDSTPAPIFGTYKETGLGLDYCFERHARNSPYGDEDRLGDTSKPQPSKVKWDTVDWGRLQHDCYVRNKGRFKVEVDETARPMFRYPNEEDIERVNDTLISPVANSVKNKRRSKSKQYASRNAILLRTYDTKKYTEDNLQHIRAMVAELSLHSGAEYEVFLLVQIIDLGRPIFDDPAAYQEALDIYVPHEFHNISVLFNVPLLEAWYPKAGKHDPNNSQQVHMTQPLQLFSLLRPDFDLYWQFELDVRYTGHHYHHLEAIRQWAARQPRKLQWERASYFYSPFIHHTWDMFCGKIRDTFKYGGIWGPVTTTGIPPLGPKPPSDSSEQDDFQWGVDEPADMINIMPMVDPVRTHMMFRNWIENYPDGKDDTPRRSAPATPLIAISRRLLRAMHHSQITMGTHMMPEMFPESSALHHGMKAVAFPEPIYLDIEDTSPEGLESIFNEQGENSMWNGGSPNANLGQHINYWWSAGFKPEYSNVLYRRWLGLDETGQRTDDRRLCLLPMTLHPIKGI